MTSRSDVYVEYSRECGGWVATSENPCALRAQGRTLREARKRITTLVRAARGDAVEIHETINLPPEVSEVVKRSRELRRRADTARAEAQGAVRDAIGLLTRSVELSGRDAAEVLEMSHQRVQQIIAASRAREEAGIAAQPPGPV